MGLSPYCVPAGVLLAATLDPRAARVPVDGVAVLALNLLELMAAAQKTRIGFGPAFDPPRFTPLSADGHPIAGQDTEVRFTQGTAPSLGFGLQKAFAVAFGD